MITVENAESYLEDKIGEDADDLKKVWETSKDFCKEPDEGEEDKEILFECGVYDFTEAELFYFNFVRQFTVYEEDQYSQMEQIHCELTDELRSLEVSWSMDYDDLDDYFNHIENLPGFKIPFNLKPIKSEIYQEEV
jgi:hypothetical protein